MSIYDFNSLYRYSNAANNLLVGTVICIVLALAGGIVLYCTFLSKKNNGKFTGFLGWLYDTLSFNSLLLELLMKICYLVTAGFITLYSIVLLFVPGAGFLTFILLLVLGNIVVRIAYEFMLILIIICRNTSEISKKLGGHDGDSSAPSFGPAAYRPGPPRQKPQFQQYQPPQQYAQQQPTYDQPAYGQPSYDQPNQQAYNQPAYDQPAYDQPAQQQYTPPPPAYPQPAEQHPAAEQPLFCSECGTKLEPGSVFCPNCGARQG